jgi:hypothetical protein
MVEKGVMKDTLNHNKGHQRVPGSSSFSLPNTHFFQVFKMVFFETGRKIRTWFGVHGEKKSLGPCFSSPFFFAVV